jgi:hypothetical protein
MRTQFFKIVLAATFGLAMALTFSCSSNDDDKGGGNNNSGGGGVPFNENSQIYNTDGSLFIGSGVLSIKNKHTQETLLNIGSVTNGIVNLQLPQTIPNEYLFVFKENGCTINPSYLNVFINEDVFVLTNSSGENIGKLYIGDEQNSQGIQYWYFSKAGKITCGNIIDINAKAGWNDMYVVVNNGKKELSTNNILTNEVKWTLYN